MPEAEAERFALARRTGGIIPAPPRPDLEGGYRIAEALYPMLGEPAGWKVGATSAGAQSVLGVSEPIRGRMFRAAILDTPAAFTPAGERPCEAEPEIVLETGAGGTGVARAFLGLEIVRPSCDEALELGAGFIVADNAAHVALVLGPEIPLAALADPDRVRVVLERNGAVAGEGSAAAVLGDPRRSLAWLAAQVTLRPRELIATGAMTRATRLARGDMVTARFGALGEVAVRWPERSEVMPARSE